MINNIENLLKRLYSFTIPFCTFICICRLTMVFETAGEKDASCDIVNDITQLNPISVKSILTPQSTEEIQQIVKTLHGEPICIGGGRFSMGGQTACENGLHLDMRNMNRILRFDKNAKTITVQPGCTWREIQEYIDPHDLSVKIMQTYANFTVGGSLSVNAHGRYIGLGPLVLSVLSIKIILANGEEIEASPHINSEIFYGAIGGYGGLGIIVEATLQLTDNIKVTRHNTVLNIDQYYDYFSKNIRDSKNRAIFHNADIYPPQYQKARLITWFQTYEPVTVEQRLIPADKSYSLQKYFIWTVSETYSGKWRRQLYVDPIFYLFKKVVWRNYEASYDVKELEPHSRKNSTYVLQEYFVPVNEVASFIKKIGKILQRYRVNVLNISIRHAIQDPGTLLSWASSEVFAFVMYYKERVNELDKNKVPIWTRELINAALSCGGRYYLPYQPHATYEQFLKAYPRAREYFKLKQKLDPNNTFRNKLLDSYHRQEKQQPQELNASEFKEVFCNTQSHDNFYLFLQNIYNIFPENPFHLLIYQQTMKHDTDQKIYAAIQEELPKIKPFLSELRYALPALFAQKKEMAKETLQLLPNDKPIDGFVEIGSTGRYASQLKKHYDISKLYFIHDVAPNFSPVDIAERGSLTKYGQFIPFNNYHEITENQIKSESIELIICYIGLHHCPPEKLASFVQSLYRILKPGGSLILRDHDVKTPQMHAFVSLVHAVFNAGLGISWENNQKELRHFNSLAYWIQYLEKFGFKTNGQTILQDYDPSLNTLIRFVK